MKVLIEREVKLAPPENLELASLALNVFAMFDQLAGA